MEFWQSISNWMLSFGAAYGVDPFIFALLYFGTIPFSLFAFAWMTKRIRAGQSIFLPVLLAFASFIGTYIYLFTVGRNIPQWVYLLIGIMMLYSGWMLFQKIKGMKSLKN